MKKTFIAEELDISGEKELVESEEELDYLDVEPGEEDEFLEEGEVIEEEEEDEIESLIRKYTKEGNVTKLKQILTLRKERCRQLKQELEDEHKKEKDREMKLVLEELERTKKTKTNLERSIASSRSNTPSGSPRRSKPKPKSTVKVITKKAPRSKHTKMAEELPRENWSEEKREYDQVLNSLLNVKSGKAEVYSELVEKAMNATDNLMLLKKSQEHDKGKNNDNFRKCARRI